MEKSIEFQPHADINKSTKLSDNLVNFYKISRGNINECLPRILRNKKSNPNIKYSTLTEQEQREKKKKIAPCLKSVKKRSPGGSRTKKKLLKNQNQQICIFQLFN